MHFCARHMVGIFGVAALAAGGCAVPTPGELVSGPLSYMQPGKVSEADLLLRFGAPTAQFDGERLLTWRIGRSHYGELAPASRVVALVDPDDDGPDDWEGTLYDLVVVFDEHRMLQRFSLVAVSEN